MFSFLNYIKPGYYFNKISKENTYPYVLRNSEEGKQIIIPSDFYETQIAREWDENYQALINGGILAFAPLKDFNQNIPLEDEYRFSKRYFKKQWSWYVLFVRLLLFYNPYKEIKAFLRPNPPKAHVKKNRSNFRYEFEKFQSGLISNEPMVSIIIPTLNRYEYLKAGLYDLEKQDYSNIEVLVVDQSENFQDKFYEQFDLDLKVIKQKEKALWKARNDAIKQSNGAYILLFDDDSRVESDWVKQHLKCLDYFRADISAGVSFSQAGGKIPEGYYYFRHADQFDTGNAMVRKDVFFTTGLFDRQFEKQRMGDGEFGLRAYLHGFKSISNPRANRLHLKVGAGGLREMGNWDAFRPKNLLAPRPIPSVLYYYRQYFPKENVYSALIQGTLPSLIPYQFKGNKKLLPFGLLFGILLSPFLLIGVFRSWIIASRMLKEGAKIDQLKDL